MNSFNKRTHQIPSFHQLLVLSLIVLLLSITQFSLSSQACHEEERSALLSFKSSLEDPSNRLSSWKEGSQNYNCCDWHGVGCSSTSSHVVSLDLRNRDLETFRSGQDDPWMGVTALKGKLSAYLFNLTHLEYLDLAWNDFEESEISFQFANLTKLTHLDLSSSEFVGSITTQFGNQSSLEYLDVSDNYKLEVNLTRISEHPWPKLRNLSLTGTNSFGSLQNLVSSTPLLASLDAAYCSIQGSIPESICKIQTLQKLSLDNNNLTGTIPKCITDLKNLTWLSVGYNSIQGNVSLISLVNELNLRTLDLSLNKLTVDINPHSPYPYYKQNNKLEKLNLGSCNLNGFPTFICDSIHLTILDLSGNNLTGALPSCFYKLKLRELDLSYNKLHGSLPVPPPYTGLYNLANNKFSGEISVDLSHASKIDLSNNELSGSIPVSLCSNILDLSHNKLTGVIPTSLGNCRNISFLNLGYNNLSGNVPSELGQAYQLEYLQLNHNNLDGPLPSFRSEKLKFLDLANNKFEGGIPVSFVPWGTSNQTIMSGLRILSLRSNKLSGPIPNEITSLQKLQILDLALNNLTGPIPEKLANWSRLTGTFIDNSTMENNYYGGAQLNLEIEGTTQLQSIYSYNSAIDLSCNNLDGHIPTDICLLKDLYSLNLSHNRLSHDIPMNIGNMSSLGNLDLSFNELSGEIPQSLTLIDFLGVMNLSYNNLSGKIPRGDHFDTLSLDGSAYIGNDLLCGFPTTKFCKEDQQRPKVEAAGVKNDAHQMLILYPSVVVLGFTVGFWGLFFV